MAAGSRAVVLVVEDDARCRALIVDVLERAGYAVIAEATGEEALAVAADTRVDLAILDIGLPGLSGYEVCRSLRTRPGRRLPIMFVSGSRVGTLDLSAGLLIGADDYLVKPFAPEELLARAYALLRRTASELPAGTESHLTSRERQVLGLLALGRTQEEIAGELFISPKTVGTHLERIIRKLGVHSRAQAVAAAYRRDLVGHPEDLPL
jgi:DNA-binding NarL/FixJ family response regulator